MKVMPLNRVVLIMPTWQAKPVLAFGKFQVEAGSVAKQTFFSWTYYSSHSYHVFNAPDKERVSQADF